MTGAPPGVEVWLIDLANAGPALAALEQRVRRLSDDELARASTLPNGEDWRLFRIALRVLLERKAGTRVRGVPYQVGGRGKPRLPWPAGVEFSLSHYGRHGLIATADDLVGVDIEQQRQVHFPAEREQAMVTAARALAPVRSTDFAILQAWVRLEAWGKARGSGVGILLYDLGVRGPTWSNDKPIRNFGDLAAELLSREQLAIHDLALPPGLHGAVAARNGAAIPLVRSFPKDVAGIETLLAAT